MTENRPEYGLKPCPFCGELKATIEPVLGASFDTPRYCVICSSCGADSQVDLGRSGAVECWNTRPIEDALNAEIADLRRRNIDLESTIASLRAELNQKNLDILDSE